MAVTGTRRFTLQQIDRSTTTPGESLVALGTVTAITTGGGTDGLDLVTVSYNGASLQVPHLASYTPVVGHVVLMVRTGGLWSIVGRLVGFPS